MKGLEALERVLCEEMALSVKEHSEDIKVVEKQLKALEIIKTKRVDVDYFLAIVRKYDDKFMDWYNQKNTNY